MDENTLRAFEWASNQNHQSVAARYARTLAEYVKSVGHIELDYPNWHGKFPTIAEAVHQHTASQDAVIRNLRRNLKDKGSCLEVLDGLTTVVEVLIQERAINGSLAIQGWCKRARDALAGGSERETPCGTAGERLERGDAVYLDEDGKYRKVQSARDALAGKEGE